MLPNSHVLTISLLITGKQPKCWAISLTYLFGVGTLVLDGDEGPEALDPFGDLPPPRALA